MDVQEEKRRALWRWCARRSTGWKGRAYRGMAMEDDVDGPVAVGRSGIRADPFPKW